MTDRGLIIFSDGMVDEVDADGYITTSEAAGLHEELAAAGYPIFGDPESTDPNCFDVSIDADGQVTAYTCNSDPGYREQAMGAVTPKLATWLELTKEDQ